ncbi:PfkB family carbohydrate kinase, partial [Candidatus Margulisiibacteriota bacterium]
KTTDLNVLETFDPKVPDAYKDSSFVLLANLDPEIQLKALSQFTKPRFVVLDTMNYWIEHTPKKLLDVVQKVDMVIINDAEIREFMDIPNVISAAKKLQTQGVKHVIVKKGEHGAILFSHDSIFYAPSYPLETVLDPTGAGDSFAGGFLGYLDSTDMTLENMRKAVIVGSTLASFNVENFAHEGTIRLEEDTIRKRFDHFVDISCFEPIKW